jgi:hypothetical protein
MTMEMVAAAVALIKEASDRGDDERAHGLDDQLRKDLLTAISQGLCTDPGWCAEIALTTEKLEFTR